MLENNNKPIPFIENIFVDRQNVLHVIDSRVSREMQSLPQSHWGHAGEPSLSGLTLNDAETTPMMDLFCITADEILDRPKFLNG